MTTGSAQADWVREATLMPVAFAQVREDPLLDLAVVEELLPHDAHILMIASGGCTAALLAACPKVKALHIVDPNPAQLALTKLKLRLLESEMPARREMLLGHAVMEETERAQAIEIHLRAVGEPSDALGPTARVATLGPDHAGRYERVFAALREALNTRYNPMSTVLLLMASDTTLQTEWAAPGTEFGNALDAALDEVMSQEHLVALFGAGAQQNRVEEFSRHFAWRIRHVLATMPAAKNPYLWQMLWGVYSPLAKTPWLSLPMSRPTANVTFHDALMTDALCAMPPATYDYIHLSNILDWLPPAEATRTLERTHTALKPGGWTLIRQLNSTLPVRSLHADLRWDVARSEAMHSADRSFFYRELHLGQRTKSA